MRENGLFYSGLGDLSRRDVVVMPSGERRNKQRYSPEDGILIHLTVTGRCYARCKGCVNSAVTLGSDLPRSEIDVSLETKPKRDREIILGLARRHPGKK